MDWLLHAFFKNIFTTGNLTVETPSGRVVKLGDGSGAPLRIAIHDRAAALRLVIDPSLALGELYTDNRLSVTEGSIYDLLALAWRNLGLADPPGSATALASLRHLTRRLAQFNVASRARRNAAHHYDLDRRLYALFLDSDLQYSCAYFTTPDATLEDAQLAKKRHIAAKLALAPGQTVLDIGSGWGGLALYLSGICGADVTGITLSQEQLKVSRERAAARADGHVTFELDDYRKVAGRYDRIVSVGMFEHVGLPFYGDYFKVAARLLEPDGVMLLHTIGRIDGPGPTNPWMAKYIFPGGYVPALSDIAPAIERAGLIVTDIEVLRLHYADTLKAWRERFLSNRDAAARLYDDRFCRMWEYYLSACESAFRFGNLVVFQIQMCKQLAALPVTRDYIDAAEANLEMLERRAVRSQTRTVRRAAGGAGLN